MDLMEMAEAAERIARLADQSAVLCGQAVDSMVAARQANESLLSKWREQDRQAEVRRVELHSIDGVTVAVLGGAL